MNKKEGICARDPVNLYHAKCRNEFRAVSDGGREIYVHPENVRVGTLSNVAKMRTARRTKTTRAFNEKLRATEAQSRRALGSPALETFASVADGRYTRGLWRCPEFFDDLYTRETFGAQFFWNVFADQPSYVLFFAQGALRTSTNACMKKRECIGFCILKHTRSTDFA